MLTFYIVFLTPVLLFVLAFLYETWLSFARLKNPSSGKGGVGRGRHARSVAGASARRARAVASAARPERGEQGDS